MSDKKIWGSKIFGGVGGKIVLRVDDKKFGGWVAKFLMDVG